MAPPAWDLSKVICRKARIQEIRPLRHALLRAGLPPETAIFTGDDAPTTCHYGAFLDGRNIACATFMQQPWESAPAWQLRGMATDKAFQSRGVGAALLSLAVRELLSLDHSQVIWCNARCPAVNFYRRHGFAVVSEVFEIPTAGPHVKMARREKPK